MQPILARGIPGVDERGHTVLRHQVSRTRLCQVFAQLQPCLVGMETMYKDDQVLYKDYDAHMMAMECSRDPKTHEVRYPIKRTLPGGETDPAGMEIDLWVRSKEQNTNNFPPFETFVHLCWEEVSWR